MHATRFAKSRLNRRDDVEYRSVAIMFANWRFRSSSSCIYHSTKVTWIIRLKCRYSITSRMPELNSEHESLDDLQLTAVHNNRIIEALYLIKQTNQPCRVCFKGVFFLLLFLSHSFAAFAATCLPRRNSIQTLFASIHIVLYAFFYSFSQSFQNRISHFFFFHTRFPRINVGRRAHIRLYRLPVSAQRCHVPIFFIICQISLEVTIENNEI